MGEYKKKSQILLRRALWKEKQQWAQARDILITYNEKKLILSAGSKTGAKAQNSYRISTIKNTARSSGRDQEHTDLTSKFALWAGVDQEICGGPFQPQAFYDTILTSS